MPVSTLARLPLHEILDAIDITGARMSYASDRACRYFYAVCWNRVKARGTDG